MTIVPSSFGKVNLPISRIYEGLELMEGYLPLSSSTGIKILAKIGRDDRVRIKDTTVYPYRCICYLKIRASDGSEWDGTGWLVSPQTVITAGHCVYIHENGGQVDEVEIIPGCNSDDSQYPFGSCTSRKFAWADLWAKGDGKSHEHDYGAIFLPDACKFGEELGYFGISDMKSGKLEKIEVSLAGYPSDKKPAGTQWFHRRRVQVHETSLLHEIDTFQGQSGAPLWRGDESGDRHVVGIHNAGREDVINHATRLNDAVYHQIVEWKAEGK